MSLKDVAIGALLGLPLGALWAYLRGFAKAWRDDRRQKHGPPQALADDPTLPPPPTWWHLPRKRP